MSGRRAREASSAAPHRSPSLTFPPEPSSTSAPHSWKNCLPWNQSPVPKRLGTAGLEGRDSGGGRTVVGFWMYSEDRDKRLYWQMGCGGLKKEKCQGVPHMVWSPHVSTSAVTTLVRGNTPSRRDLGYGYLTEASFSHPSLLQSTLHPAATGILFFLQQFILFYFILFYFIFLTSLLEYNCFTMVC